MSIVQRKSLVRIQNCYTHRLCLNTLKLLTFGDLQIEMLQNEKKSVCITVNDFYYFFENKETIVKYQGNTIITYYLLDGNKGLYAFTVLKENLEIINFEKTLELSNVQLVNSSELDDKLEIKGWIEQHWGNYSTQDIMSANMINRLISKSGNFVNKKLESLQNKAVNGIRNKTTEYINKSGKTRSVTVQNEQAQSQGFFNKLKKGSNFALDKTTWALSSVFNPVMNGIQKATNKLSQKIDKSNSNFLKRTKQFWNVSELSIRTSVQGIKNSIQGIGSQLYHDGKQIIQNRIQQQPAIATTQQALFTNNKNNNQLTDAPIMSNKEQQVQNQLQYKQEPAKQQKQNTLKFPILPEIKMQSEIKIQSQNQIKQNAQVLSETIRQQETKKDLQKIKLDQLSDHESIEQN